MAQGATIAACCLHEPIQSAITQWGYPVGLRFPHPAGRYRPGRYVYLSPARCICRDMEGFLTRTYPPRVWRDLGQRRGPTAPGEESFPSPDQKCFRISTTRTTRGRKNRSPGSILPRRVWKPQLHWVIAVWLVPIEAARVEICPSCQCRGPATR